MIDDLSRQWRAFLGPLGQSDWPWGTPGPAAGAGRGLDSYARSAEEFAAAARTYFEAAAKGGPAAGDAMRGFGEFLRDQSMDLLSPLWNADLSAAAPPSLPELPALGLTREHQQRWQRTAEAARRMADAQRRLQRFCADALREAAAAFAARQGPAPGAIDAEFLRQVYDAWIACAEEAYARAAHGEGFCRALAEYVNASSLWREEMRASIEHVAKAFDLPTRSEINTLARRLHSLEEALAALRKAPPAARKAAKSARRPAPRPPKRGRA